MATFKNYLSTLPLEAKDDYKTHIRPVLKIIKIFKNLFLGRYIHFGSLISMNLQIVEEMFLNLCELICSIKLENFLGHISKTNVAYYLLKVVFCEYIGYLNLDKFSNYLNVLMKMIEEGLESLDNVALISTHQIVT